MPDTKFDDSAPVRLPPIAIPDTAAFSPGEWHSRGLCIGEDPEVFFPSRGNPGSEAREICTACRVRHECLKYAIDADEFGIWGGLDQTERRNLRRRQRRKDATAPSKTKQSKDAA
jgi:WhiB family redox-sensing transcriptional regulator